jgi:hypothetical protein
MGNPQEEATQLKNKGNESFKNQDWATAVDFYTKAIELWDKEPSFYLNRAQVCERTSADMARLLTPLYRQILSSNPTATQSQMPTMRSTSIRTMSR